MIPKYTNLQFTQANVKDLLPLECKQCTNTFYKTKHFIQGCLNPKQKTTGEYCSRTCESKKFKVKVICQNCNKDFIKARAEIIKFPNHFCSHSCSATYNNKNKSYGYRRSKLEIWLEEQLTILYPNLQIKYNSKSAIKSELDIYIPSLNLAFELNGIFHYEPIYGIDKLNKIKLNDISKSRACHKAKIDLCIIDTSSHTYVKPKTSQKYLDIIMNIINERVSNLDWARSSNL